MDLHDFTKVDPFNSPDNSLGFKDNYWAKILILDGKPLPLHNFLVLRPRLLPLFDFGRASIPHFRTMKATTGLILEGGGMRGVFTIGVLDYLMDVGIEFPYGIGVSAGACHGLSYLSRQRGRAKQSAIDLLARYRYVGLKHLIQTHAIFDQEMLYDRIPHELLPYDYDAAFDNPMHFEMVVTNCQTGRAEYLSEKSDRQRLLSICKASSSLPFVAPICLVDEQPMLDGGIADPIPVERAIRQGFPKNVIVLTRNRGYRDGRDIKMPRFVYANYPRLRVMLSKMRSLYNAQIELVERLEESGRLLAIRPERPLEVERLETDPKKLSVLYEEGYECARQRFNTPFAQSFLT